MRPATHGAVRAAAVLLAVLFALADAGPASAHSQQPEILGTVAGYPDTVAWATADGTASAMVNSSPRPREWLGRFGRTAWEHTLLAVNQRLRSAHVPAARAAVAGRQITVADASRDGVLTLRGQGAFGQFMGQDDDLAVNGDVASGTLGVDYAFGPWLAGLALSHSGGWGRYSRSSTPGGEVTSTLTGAYPYLGVEAARGRLSLWVAGGYGLGELRLAPSGGAALETETGLLAGAAGVRATLLPAAATGGLALGLNADVLLLRATSEEAPGLAAEAADVNRVRLGLEGLYTVALGASAQLTPSLEVGIRRDGGDAETGFGIDAGAGLRYTHLGLGLSLGLSGHALLVHETAQVAEWGASGWLAWDPNPASELGPALTVSPSFGGRSEGRAQERWGRQTLAGLDAGQADVHGAGRVDAKLAYGMPLGFGVGVPWAGIGAAEREREYRLGYAIQAGDPSATGVRVELVATRREPTGAEPEHTLAVHSTVRW